MFILALVVVVAKETFSDGKGPVHKLCGLGVVRIGVAFEAQLRRLCHQLHFRREHSFLLSLAVAQVALPPGLVYENLGLFGYLCQGFRDVLGFVLLLKGIRVASEGGNTVEEKGQYLLSPGLVAAYDRRKGKANSRGH